MNNVNTAVTTQNEQEENQRVLNDLNLANLPDSKKEEIAKTWSIQKIDNYMIFIQNNDKLDEQSKNQIIDNMLEIRNLKDGLNKNEEESIKKEAEEINQIQEEKKNQKESDLQQVDELKRLLGEKNDELLNKDKKIDAMQDDINSLKEQLKQLSDKNHDALESLKDAKKNNDQKIIDKQRKTIIKLIEEKNALKDKYAGKLPKYEGDIKTLDTKRIELKGFGSNSVDGQKVLTGPQLKFRQNLRSRYRINTTVRELNKIGNDPKKGVNFVLTRTFGYDPLNVSGKVGSGFKNMRKFFKIRDVKVFDEMYNKQKKYFIDDLEAKMDANSMSENDKKVIAAIRNRLDYYQAAYKRQFITA